MRIQEDLIQAGLPFVFQIMTAAAAEKWALY